MPEAQLDTLSLLSRITGLGYGAAIVLFVLLVIIRRRPVGVTLSWLLLLFMLPGVGVALFLMFGTQRLGSKRLRRVQALTPAYEEWAAHLRQIVHPRTAEAGYNQLPEHNRVYNLAQHSSPIPAIPGNRLSLFHTPDNILSALEEDIRQAHTSIHMELYICQPGGRIDAVLDSLEAAALRQVSCRLLLDAVGSSRFLRSARAQRLRQAGVNIRASLPVGPVRMLFERMDLRNHRKLVVIDHHIAWTGSFNLADPALFRQNTGAGPWVDAMVRIQGPAAHMSNAIFLHDWDLEARENASIARQTRFCHRVRTEGASPVHVVPSGPGRDRQLIHQVLLAAAYESQKELVISTPYFVPDEALVTALCSAARRGVKVVLIVPERNDSRMVHHASRSYYDELLEAKVAVMHFTGGLLHTKCVLVDRETVLFGTVNLDMRSVWLNFEVTLIVYDQVFGQRMAQLLEGYAASSRTLSMRSWKGRSFLQKIRENLAQILSPLL